MTVLVALTCLVLGGVLGWSIGSSGPCPDCDGLPEPSTARLIHEQLTELERSVDNARSER